MLSSIQFVLFHLIVQLAKVRSDQPNLISNQYNALWEFYNSTNGKFWTWRNGSIANEKWIFSSSANPCSDNWQGIQCSCEIDCNLTHLELPNYNLSGSLPVLIGEWTSLQSLNLTSNNIQGEIPNIFGNWTFLKLLDLSRNSLINTLPSSIGNSSSLLEINLNNNQLFGSLPSSIRELHELQILNLNHNLLSGSLEFLSLLSNLTILKLNRNIFTGSLHNYFQSDFQLRAILVGNNFFIGSIPFNNKWRNLTNYYINNNYFSSSIPSDFTNVTKIQYFSVANNFVTGAISDDWFLHCVDLLVFNISYNAFSGPLPSTYSNVSPLTHFLVSDNELTGSISSNITNLKRLNVLLLDYNRFTGTIPTSFRHLQELQQLFITNNQLTGSITDLLNNSLSSSLTNIDVSANQFTGSLPSNYFQENQNLKTFAVVDNCLHGSIPESICEATDLTSLSLDGLANAEECRIYFFGRSSSSNTFIVKNSIAKFPLCLFQMARLQNLHLSGNYFTGSFPSSLNISSSLNTLVLSFNKLTGTIPDYIQQRKWSTLDLSYNKLSGSLSNNFGMPINSTLILQFNRLSGSIPSTIQNLEDINVLLVNMFSCDSFHPDLPVHDPREIIYTCGSNRVDDILYIWTVCFVLIGGVLVVCFVIQRRTTYHEQTIAMKEFISSSSYSFSIDLAPTEQPEPPIKTQSLNTSKESALARPSFSSNVKEQLPQNSDERKHTIYILFQQAMNTITSWKEALESHKTGSPTSEITQTITFLQEIRRACLIILMVAIILLIPIYAVLTIYAKSYQNAYAWTIAGILLSGETPAIILFFILLLFTTLIFTLLKRIFDNYSDNSNHINQNENLLSQSVAFLFLKQLWANNSIPMETEQLQKIGDHVMTRNEVFTTRLFIFSYNFALIAAVDVAYVFLELNFGATSLTVAMAGFGIACFRVLTNNILLWKTIPYTSQIVVSLTTKTCNAKRIDLSHSSLATSTSNPLRSSGSPDINRDPEEMWSSTNQDVNKNMGETGIDSYNFTRADVSFLERLMLLNSIIIPVFSIFLVFPDCFYHAIITQPIVNSSYDYESCVNYVEGENSIINYCSSLTQETSFAPAFEYTYQCSAQTIIYYSPVYIANFLIIGFLLPLKNMLLKFCYHKALENYGPNSLSFQFCNYWLPQNLQNLLYEKPAKPHKVFKKLIVTTQLSSYFGIILIFGGLFPPVSITGCISIYIMTYYEELLIGRVLYESSKQNIQWYKEKLEEDCKDIAYSLNLSLRSTIVVSCFFFGFVIFDVFGDQQGWRAALPLALVMAFFPCLLGFCYQVYRFLKSRVGK